MHQKIKGIRTSLGLSEKQVSEIINISCYKYKRFENNTIPIECETLILLSLMYNIPIDYIIYDKYSLYSILRLEVVENLKSLDIISLIRCMEFNLFSYSNYQFTEINYRVVKNILAFSKTTLSQNLYNLRTDALIEIREIASDLRIPEDQYLRLEQGKTLPKPLQLKAVADFFSTTIQNILLP